MSAPMLAMISDLVPHIPSLLRVTTFNVAMSRGGHLRRNYFACGRACATIILKRLR